MFDKFIKTKGDISPALLDFLSGEDQFFSGALRRSKNTPMAQREAWRKETVYERRLRVSKEVFEMMNGVVGYGPLKGLKLADDAWWGAPDKASMLLGLYEQELLDVLTSKPLINKSYFIDIGAADGYYGIGLVMAGFYKKSFCFEISEKGRLTIKNNAEVNGVSDKVQVFGAADQALAQHLPQECIQDAVVLVDIEGGEEAFFRGGKDTLHRDNPVILFESMHTGPNYPERQFLRDLGYRLYFLEKNQLSEIPEDSIQAGNVIAIR